MNKSLAALGVLAAAGAAVVLAGDRRKIAVRRYRVIDKRVLAPVRLLVLSDLHCTLYGKEQRQLTELVRSLSPDAILFPGDTDDGIRGVSPALAAVRACAGIAPCFLTLGNHELLLRRERLVAAAFKRAGATVLAGDRVRFKAKSGGVIDIAGVPDYRCFKTYEADLAFDEALASAAPKSRRRFTVLLSHRPELFPLYRSWGFDLSVCGHAHGGQWRVPGLINGVFAPGQGLLPKYAGGLYLEKGRAMVVSRGLALGNTPVPRLFNPPEICVVELSPVDKA